MPERRVSNSWYCLDITSADRRESFIIFARQFISISRLSKSENNLKDLSLFETSTAKLRPSPSKRSKLFEPRKGLSTHNPGLISCFFE